MCVSVAFVCLGSVRAFVLLSVGRSVRCAWSVCVCVCSRAWSVRGDVYVCVCVRPFSTHPPAAAGLKLGVPTVCVVLEGGPGLVATVLDYVSGVPPVPVLVFEGSGGAADLLAFLHKQTALDR